MSLMDMYNIRHAACAHGITQRNHFMRETITHRAGSSRERRRSLSMPLSMWVWAQLLLWEGRDVGVRDGGASSKSSKAFFLTK